MPACSRFLVAAFLCLAGMPALAPAQAAEPLTIGSPAPTLEVEAWLKGEPITALDRGRVYLVEFWATWCGPCVAGMPHLTRLQAAFGDTVTVVGVNIWEVGGQQPYTDETRAAVEKFVAAHEADLGYRVAFDGGARGAATAWMAAAGLNGIPAAFIVDRQGTIAHIGHPMAPEFAAALRRIVDGTHDLAAARVQHEEQRAAQSAAQAARAAAWLRVEQVVAVALPLVRTGDHAAAVAACDSLGPATEPTGDDPRDEARIQVFRELCNAGEYDTAHAWVDHLLAAGALGSPGGWANLAWVMVDPVYGVKGADPARAVLCSERAVADLESEPEMFRPLLLDTHAMALAAAGRLEEAIAVQARAVEMASNETMKTMMTRKLEEYRGRQE